MLLPVLPLLLVSLVKRESPLLPGVLHVLLPVLVAHLGLVNLSTQILSDSVEVNAGLDLLHKILHVLLADLLVDCLDAVARVHILVHVAGTLALPPSVELTVWGLGKDVLE